MLNIYLQGKISENVYSITADFMAFYIVMTTSINDINLQKPMICGKVATNFVKKE